MKIKIDNNYNLFCTADLHLNHKNIIKYCDRPFKSVEEMNEKIISNWNNKVDYSDNVLILGDFCFGDEDMFDSFYDRLNGYKIFVRGNHDKRIPKDIQVYDVAEFSYKGHEYFCSHFAHRVWNKSHRGSIHLYGHSHGTLPDDPNSLSMDVGIDCHPNFEPFSESEILNHIKKKTFKAVDHHE